MADLEELIKTREELERRRYTGHRSMQIAGRELHYKSDAEMQSAIQALDKRIATAQGRASITTVRVTSSKGF